MLALHRRLIGARAFGRRLGGPQTIQRSGARLAGLRSRASKYPRVAAAGADRRRRAVAQRLVRAFVVVGRQSGADAGLGLAHGVVGAKLGHLILQAEPEVLEENVVPAQPRPSIEIRMSGRSIGL